MFAASKTDGSAVAPDAQFNYVTMLLHGDGTNGAQNNTFLDSSTNNFTITRNGNTTQGSFSPYGSNWSNYFDGTGDYLTVPDNSAWAFGSGNFTLEAWVYRTVNGATQMIVIQSDNASAAGSAWSFYILSTNKLVSNVYYGSSFITLTSSADVPANAWVHVALVRTSGTISQYINGSRDGTSASLSTNSLNDVAQTVGIGATNAGNERITGYISNLRVIKGAGPYDATSSTLTVPTTALTAITNTQLLTCADNRFIDDSANNFTITRNGDVSVQRFNPFGTATAYSTSVIGGSGYFDGSGDYLSVANDTALQFGTGDFTVEGWFYMTGGNFSNNSLFSIGSYNGGFLLRYKAAGSDNFYFNNTGYDWNPSTNFRLNQWNHVAVVRSGTTVSVYVNGTSVFSVTNSSSLAQSTATSIGTATHDVSNESCLGYISNFRMVKGTAVYTANFTPPTAPVTAITNTSLLTNFTNGAIFDNAMMNDLETVGNAQISTSVVKYGTGSMYFDGTGDGLFTVSKPDLAFGTGDFTVEFWLYLAANLNTFAKVIQMGTSGNCFTIEAQGTANVLNVSNFTSTVYLTSNTALTTGTWIHVAVTRASGTLRIFQNGSSVGGVSNSIDFPNVGGIYIGRSSTGQETNGYIDDLRITKGFARYTSAFTPPTSALSDTGPI